MSIPAVYITLTLTQRQRDLVRDALSVYTQTSAPTEEEAREALRLHETLNNPWPEVE